MGDNEGVFRPYVPLKLDCELVLVFSRSAMFSIYISKKEIVTLN